MTQVLGASPLSSFLLLLSSSFTLLLIIFCSVRLLALILDSSILDAKNPFFSPLSCWVVEVSPWSANNCAGGILLGILRASCTLGFSMSTHNPEVIELLTIMYICTAPLTLPITKGKNNIGASGTYFARLAYWGGMAEPNFIPM